MDIYKLDHDEAIILQAGTVMRDGYDESQYEDEELNELVLTNKNLIYIILDVDTEKETAVKVPLNSIKAIGGKVQAKEMNHEVYGRCLQVQFKHGIEYWRFGRKSKVLIPQWVDALNAAFSDTQIQNESVPILPEMESVNIHQTEDSAEIVNNATVHNSEPVSGINLDGVENSVERDKTPKNQTIDAEKTNSEPVIMNCDGTAQQTGKKRLYCSSCGTELNVGAKFCYACGNPTQSSATNRAEKRNTVYEGAMHKCPGCGETLNSFMSVCPSCGYEVRNSRATTSVKELYEHLENAVSKEKKIEIIKMFPIPNTKEDLHEFLILASSNIDFDCYHAAGTPFRNVDRIQLSDAWWTKYEQAYQKAILIFASDSKLESIQNRYLENKKHLKKAKYRIWKIVGKIFAIIYGVSFAIGIIALIALAFQ